MSLRTMGTIALGPNGKFQGIIRCFNLVSGENFIQNWKESSELKMPINAISCIKRVAKNQKCVKGINFVDHHNDIDATIST